MRIRVCASVFSLNAASHESATSLGMRIHGAGTLSHGISHCLNKTRAKIHSFVPRYSIPLLYKYLYQTLNIVKQVQSSLYDASTHKPIRYSLCVSLCSESPPTGGAAAKVIPLLYRYKLKINMYRKCYCKIIPYLWLLQYMISDFLVYNACIIWS